LKLKTIFFPFYRSTVNSVPFLFYVFGTGRTMKHTRDEKETCGMNAKKLRVDAKESADEEQSTEIGGLSEG
jgi:hypothetical protein